MANTTYGTQEAMDFFLSFEIRILRVIEIDTYLCNGMNNNTEPR